MEKITIKFRNCATAFRNCATVNSELHNNTSFLLQLFGIELPLKFYFFGIALPLIRNCATINSELHYHQTNFKPFDKS